MTHIMHPGILPFALRLFDALVRECALLPLLVELRCSAPGHAATLGSPAEARLRRARCCAQLAGGPHTSFNLRWSDHAIQSQMCRSSGGYVSRINFLRLVFIAKYYEQLFLAIFGLICSLYRGVGRCRCCLLGRIWLSACCPDRRFHGCAASARRCTPRRRAGLQGLWVRSAPIAYFYLQMLSLVHKRISNVIKSPLQQF